MGFTLPAIDSLLSYDVRKGYGSGFLFEILSGAIAKYERRRDGGAAGVDAGSENTGRCVARCGETWDGLIVAVEDPSPRVRDRTSLRSDGSRIERKGAEGALAQRTEIR